MLEGGVDGVLEGGGCVSELTELDRDLLPRELGADMMRRVVT